MSQLAEIERFSENKYFHLHPDAIVHSSQQSVINLAFTHDREKFQSDTKFKALLDALPAGVVVVNGKGLVDECNPAAIALLGEPLLGESWRDVIERAFDPMPSDQDMRTKEGRIVNISTCPLGDNVAGQIILLQDVSATRRLQSQLEQQKRLTTMGKMAAQLAHQIRTPISSALLYASHLKKNNLSEQHRLKFADKVLNRIRNLENLIKDMLLFSKNGVEQGDICDVNEFFKQIQQSLPDKSHVDIQFQNKTLQPQNIFINPNLMLSAVINLIENAEQAVMINAAQADQNTAQNNSSAADNHCAKVVVSMENRVSGYIDLSVSDNGPGIDSASIAHIYEPFYTTKPSGTGLGLAVVKSICHGHQGELWLENTGTQGSTFVIRLPLNQSAKNLLLTKNTETK